MGEPLGQTDSADDNDPLRPPDGHWRSLAFWVWWAVLSVLFLYAIGTVIPIEAPDDVSVPRAIVLNASNLLTSVSAAHVVARGRYHDSVLRRPKAGGGPESV